MKTSELKKGNRYFMTDKYFTFGKDMLEITFIESLSDGTLRFSFVKEGQIYSFACGPDFVEKFIIEIPEPKIGQYVFDSYYNTKKQVKGIANGLFYIGSDHEPVHRNEFIFPLPKN